MFAHFRCIFEGFHYNSAFPTDHHMEISRTPPKKEGIIGRVAVVGGVFSLFFEIPLLSGTEIEPVRRGRRKFKMSQKCQNITFSRN